MSESRSKELEDCVPTVNALKDLATRIIQQLEAEVKAYEIDSDEAFESEVQKTSLLARIADLQANLLTAEKDAAIFEGRVDKLEHTNRQLCKELDDAQKTYERLVEQTTLE